MSRSRLLRISFLAVLLSLTFPSFSYAYLDPGTGSYIFQLLIAGLFGLLFVLKIYWNRVKSFAVQLFSRDEEVMEIEGGQSSID